MSRIGTWCLLLLVVGFVSACSSDGGQAAPASDGGDADDVSDPLVPDGSSEDDAQTEEADAGALEADDSGTMDSGTMDSGSSSGACMRCSGSCVDLMVDAVHCGACNTPCSGKCVAGRCESCQVALYVMADLSGSMNQPFVSGDDAGVATGDAGSYTRIKALKGALQAFIDEPGSAGKRIGLGQYPMEAAADAGSGCAPGTECNASSSTGMGCCPNGGLCVPVIGCVGTGAISSCDALEYAKPRVAMSALPAAASALQAAIAAFDAGGQSPEIPALEGALSYARTQVAAHTKVSVLLFADGAWNTCGTADAGMGATAPMVELAARYASGSPAVNTYVLGIQGDADAGYFDPIAAAGATGRAYVATSGVEIGKALQAIRAHAEATCW